MQFYYEHSSKQVIESTNVRQSIISIQSNPFNFWFCISNTMGMGFFVGSKNGKWGLLLYVFSNNLTPHMQNSNISIIKNDTTKQTF